MHAFVTCPCRYEWSGDTLFIFRFGEGLNYKGPGTVEYLKNPAPFHCRVIYLHTSHSSDLEIESEANNNQSPSWEGKCILVRIYLCFKEFSPAFSLVKARNGQCLMKDNTT